MAEQLGVPKLLEAEDMLIEPYPDVCVIVILYSRSNNNEFEFQRQSLIVYLTELYQRLTGAAPVSGLGSNRSSRELPTIVES